MAQYECGRGEMPTDKCMCGVEGGRAGGRELPISQSHSELMVYKPIASFTFISLKYFTSFFCIITGIVSDIDSLRFQEAPFFNCIEIGL